MIWWPVYRSVKIKTLAHYTTLRSYNSRNDTLVEQGSTNRVANRNIYIANYITSYFESISTFKLSNKLAM